MSKYYNKTNSPIAIESDAGSFVLAPKSWATILGSSLSLSAHLASGNIVKSAVIDSPDISTPDTKQVVEIQPALPVESSIEVAVTVEPLATRTKEFKPSRRGK